MTSTQLQEEGKLGRSRREIMDDNRVILALREGFLLALNPDMCEDLNMEPHRDTEKIIHIVTQTLTYDQKKSLLLLRSHFPAPCDGDLRGPLLKFLFGEDCDPLQFHEILKELGTSERGLNVVIVSAPGSLYNGNANCLQKSIKDTINLVGSTLFTRPRTLKIFDTFLDAIRYGPPLTHDDWKKAITRTHWDFCWTCIEYSIPSNSRIYQCWFESGGKRAVRYSISCIREKLFSDMIFFIRVLTVCFCGLRVEKNEEWQRSFICIVEDLLGNLKDSEGLSPFPQMLQLYLKIIRDEEDESSLFRSVPSLGLTRAWKVAKPGVISRAQLNTDRMFDSTEGKMAEIVMAGITVNKEDV